MLVKMISANKKKNVRRRDLIPPSDIFRFSYWLYEILSNVPFVNALIIFSPLA